MNDEIRKVIYLDDMKEQSSDEISNETKSEKEDIKNKYLSESELKNKLESYKGRIPSVILKDLFELLKNRNLTETDVEKIVQNVENKLKNNLNFNISDLYRKIDKLEKLVQNLIVKQQTAFVERVDHSDEIGAEIKANDPPIQNINPSFLTEIPKSPRAMMFLLRWIEYMIERVGYSGLEDVLDYYVDIGWISENVMFEVLNYAKGIKLYHENSDWRPIGFMNVQDHIISLLFIEALKSGKMNKEVVQEVERQINRIKKGVCEINGI